MKLKLEWRLLDAEHMALVIDRATWEAFQEAAESRGVDASEMIAEAVASLLTPIAEGCPLN